MNIKILDSWLREYLKTSATPKKIAERLSLTSVSVERIEKYNDDFVYDVEVTTNRPEMMSVVCLAREAATALKQSGIDASFIEPKFKLPSPHVEKSPALTIKFDEKLVNRISAVIMEIKIKESPKYVKERLDASGIRSLNNVIDITNYVMRETGHPSHVFDYDRLSNHTLIIRESKKGEKMQTLDGKEYTLSGKDIIADNGKGEIVDLISIMGTANSVVTNTTKRILFFIDNVDPHRLRKTSMEHGIRTEAVILNEKGINPERVTEALARGIELFEKLAEGKIVSEITDIYPHPSKETVIVLPLEKITSVIGIEIQPHKSIEILKSLGFQVIEQEKTLHVTVPAEMSGIDMMIPEDLIEEIARIYGYENIPDTLPQTSIANYLHLGKNEFYWEDRIKDALKYWGFTEVYTYPMVSAKLYGDTPTENLRVKIQNPLNDDMVYMRSTLIPSLLEVVKENQDYERINIFEIGNVYLKNGKDLPNQIVLLSGVIKNKKSDKELFYEAKGIIEELLEDLGITSSYLQTQNDGIYLYLEPKGKNLLGKIIISEGILAFELNLQNILQHATLKKAFKPISKYPPVVEDLAIIASANVQTGELIDAIKNQSKLIQEVSLLDTYHETRTFHILYQSYDKNLTDEEIGDIREKILKVLNEKFSARLKG